MIREKISAMIQDAIDGNMSCCEVHAELKQIETLVEAGLLAIKSGAIAEAEEFNKGESYFGGTWQIRSNAATLDYDQDSKYKEYKDLLSTRKKDLNAAWKAKHEGKGFFDQETGEEIPVLPVKKPGSQSAIWTQEKPKAEENTGEGKKMIFDS